MLQVNQLCGFGALSGRAPLTTLTLFGSAVGTSTGTVNNAVTAPASIQAGDLMIFCQTNTSNNATLPSGFTLINTITDGTTLISTSYKIAAGNEGGTTITGATGLAFQSTILAVFRGDVPISAVTVASVASQNAGTNTPTNQVVTSSTGLAPLIVFGGYRAANTGADISPRGMSPAKDGEFNSTFLKHYLAYKIYNASPANVTVSMADHGVTNMLQSFYLAAA
jgi:hypothetical protein